MAVTNHPLLVLRAPDGKVVALPDRVLDSFVVNDAAAQARLQPLLANPQSTGWQLIGEATGTYTEPAGRPATATDIAAHTPHYVGITGIH